MNTDVETPKRHHCESPFALRVVVLCAMTGVLMQALHTTIANVALTYMQGAVDLERR